LVESGKLDELPYIASGAHWAIGVLAVCIITSLYVDVPEWVTGPLCAAFIVAAIVASLRLNKAQKLAELSDTVSLPVGVPQVSEA
jgi:hypothetical protein